MSRPRIKTVNVVTIEHGRRFVEKLFEKTDVGDACDETGILIWPGDDHADARDDETESIHELTADICRRVFEAVRDRVAETFARVANAAIDEERQRVDVPLHPRRIETVPIVTENHGRTFAAEIHRLTASSGSFFDAIGRTGIMSWPDDPGAQEHFKDLEDEIGGRLHEATSQAVAAAFTRIANDVIVRERRRR